jgi:hypothetical protein
MRVNEKIIVIEDVDVPPDNTTSHAVDQRISTGISNVSRGVFKQMLE